MPKVHNIAKYPNICVTEYEFENVYYLWYGGYDAVDNTIACLINDYYGDYLERANKYEAII